MIHLAELSPVHGQGLTPGETVNLEVTAQRNLKSWTLGAGTAPGASDFASSDGLNLIVIGPPPGPQITVPMTVPDAGSVWYWFAGVDALGSTQTIQNLLPVTGSQWTGFDWFEAAVLDHVNWTWSGLGNWSPSPGEESPPPPLRWPNRTPSIEVGGPLIEVHLLWESREQFGPSPCRNYRAWGILQHDVIVAEGIGTAGLMQLLDRIGPMWQAHSIPGLSTYPAQPPRPAPGVPEGWYGRQVDVRFRWEWSRQEP